MAKDLLAAADIQDTEMAPASDLFEIGGRVQVLRKGTLFAARANKLYDLYRRYESLDQIDRPTLEMIQKNYFKRSIEEVWSETRTFYLLRAPEIVASAETNPKQKMAMIFSWYLIHSNRAALNGRVEDKIDSQIHCGSAMGAFNQWVRGTPRENWRNRHADDIAEALMQGCAAVFHARLAALAGRRQAAL
jgi:trans-AT polyketide synthase/acyltransferase/oxidoreductase domain-containing protein